MRPPLTIAVAQPCTHPRDPAANAAQHAELVIQGGARVVVFPELSLTGYEFDAGVIDPGDERLAPIEDACYATGSIVLAGAPVRSEDATGRSIGVLRFGDGAASVAYRKMHLSEAERDHYAPGSGPTVIAVDGWRLGLAICKDTGVEAHAAAAAAAGMDVYLAGVLEHEQDVGIVASRARGVARKHAVWVAMASFAGTTGEGFNRAAGHSGIWRPDGLATALAGPACDEVVATELQHRIA